MFKYLFETSGVHAVVICDLTNVPPRVVRETEFGTQPANPFKAEIAVWSRKATGSVGSDYPLDPCYHQGESADHKVGDSGDSTSNSSFGQSHTDPSSLVLDEFDHSAREYFRSDPNNPENQQRIYRRSAEWIVVCDESAPTGQGGLQSELILDVYDFLRPCSQLPNSYIRDRDIVVPLKALRSRL
ncbi:unnamed protein product, partial [Rhizoctonia solani]